MKKSVDKKTGLGMMGLMLILMLTGCILRPPASTASTAYRVITQIMIRYEDGPLQMQRHFSHPDKLQLIVDYLRRIDPYGFPKEEPEGVAGSTFQITLLYSDGSQRTYLQHADRYMRIGDGPWKRIDPEKAIALSQILGQLPSDPTPEDTSPIPPLLQPEI